jgi:NADPH-dependent 2,4-dienoyl-CoA reductase/sulfur reductase-like enzyme
MREAPREIRTRCCIVGGGPAGMMLGLLLARGGVPVTVLEKHADFLRDFRGLRPFPYLALAPQWDFLDLLADAARRHPSVRVARPSPSRGLLEVAA